jgi:hypothetical protein
MSMRPVLFRVCTADKENQSQGTSVGNGIVVVKVYDPAAGALSLASSDQWEMDLEIFDSRAEADDRATDLLADADGNTPTPFHSPGPGASPPGLVKNPDFCQALKPPSFHFIVEVFMRSDHDHLGPRNWSFIPRLLAVYRHIRSRPNVQYGVS